ncbi:MAG: peptidyl-alpha-hydroxyglycine alpha-amidating lyase family protein [Bryobacteraceae bacterium]|jgi:hypothetical protein
MRSTLFSLLATALLSGAAFAQSAPEISFDSSANFLKLPEHIHLGEAAGVATNSKGHVFVYTRTGDAYATIGSSRTFVHGGSRLFEFDQTGKFVREFGQGSYAMMAAQAVRVDPQDNVWIVDRYSSMVIKFDPEGRVLMPMGRKPESINVVAPGAAAGGGGRGGRGLPGAGTPGDLFNQPSDVAFDSSGDIFVSDGYGNARVAKFDKNGWFIKSWGSKGTETGKFDRPSSVATDAQGNVYVAEIGNKRIQVFDNDGNFKSEITNIGTPAAICISPGPHQFLYSSNSNESNTMDNGEIYKLELDGKVLGKFGRAGKLPKEFGTVNEIDCRRPNELVVGELANWRVQKLTLHP